jgi:hypothetical protein
LALPKGFAEEGAGHIAGAVWVARHIINSAGNILDEVPEAVMAFEDKLRLLRVNEQPRVLRQHHPYEGCPAPPASGNESRGDHGCEDLAW